jgi:hypothetical protein
VKKLTRQFVVTGFQRNIRSTSELLQIQHMTNDALIMEATYKTKSSGPVLRKNCTNFLLFFLGRDQATVSIDSFDFSCARKLRRSA